MPKTVVTFAVADVARWLTFKEESFAIVEPFATEPVAHLALDGSNNVAMSANVHDMRAMPAALGSPSPEVQATEEGHGVIRPIIAYIEK